MSIPQHYQSLSIILYYILFFGIAKCDTVNVNCNANQNCQSNTQPWYTSSAGQARRYEVSNLGAGYQMTLDIYVSNNEQDWSIIIASATGQVTVSVLVDGQTKISPYTDYAMRGSLYLSQTSESSRLVRFKIQNLNALFPTTVDLDLGITRFVPYTYYESGSSKLKLSGTIIVAVAGAILVLIIIGVTTCYIRRRKRLALQRRLQAANRSALDPIVNNTQLNNSSFHQQNMPYMQDNSFTLQQYGQPVKPQFEFAQPIPQYNQFIQPQLQPQPQIYELQPANQMYMPAYPQPQTQVQVQVQPQQIMIQPAPQGY